MLGWREGHSKASWKNVVFSLSDEMGLQTSRVLTVLNGRQATTASFNCLQLEMARDNTTQFPK